MLREEYRWLAVGRISETQPRGGSYEREGPPRVLRRQVVAQHHVATQEKHCVCAYGGVLVRVIHHLFKFHTRQFRAF
jgi:hypothetical protein